MTPPAPDPILEHPVGRWLLERRDRLRGLERRRPWLLDTQAAVLILLLSLPDVLHGGRPVDVAAALLLLVPLYWRRRHPFAAFATVAAMLLAQWLAGIWVSTGIVLLVVLYGVAARSSMRKLAWAAAITTAEFTLGVLFLAPLTEHQLATLLLVLGTCSAGIAIGLAARTSRAYLTALETDRERRARLAVAAEQARVAREMHDIVGHHVSIMIGLADGGATMAANRGEKAAEPLRLIAETGRQALDDLRRVLGVLRDDAAGAQLSPQPGLADVERLLDGVRTAGLTVTYRTSGDLHGLGQGLQLAVYRIVQEALTNTLKHAGPGATAQVTVAAAQGEVQVRVADGGPVTPSGSRRARGGGGGGGSGPRTSGETGGEKGGNGIVGIRERASLYGGVVTAGPDGDGWLVDVVLTEPATRTPR